jgi:hypothetical protein
VESESEGIFGGVGVVESEGILGEVGVGVVESEGILGGVGVGRNFEWSRSRKEFWVKSESESWSRKEFWVESESIYFYRLLLQPWYKTLSRY